MANPDDLNDFTFETHNPQYSYGSRLSWPLQPPPPASPAQPPAVVSKRSTSPLPLALNTSAFAHQHQHAPTYPSAAIMADWARVASTKEPMTYPSSLENASFTQQPFESFGTTPFQASPTDFMPPPTDMQTAGMEANVGANGLPMDPASYVNVGMSMGNVNTMNNMNLGSISQMEQGAMNALETMSNLSGWSDLGSMYNVEELQRMLAMQPQHSQGSHHTTAATAGFSTMPGTSEYAGGSDGGNEYEVRSLSSSDNGYVLVGDQHSPHLTGGAIFNPGETLHPRTSSQSSCSDEHHHGHGSYDGSSGGSYSSDVPHSAGSPSATSAIFHSDHEHYYDYERPSPPVAALTPAAAAAAAATHPHHLMQPLETHHASTTASSAITSPQRSPTSPASRKPPKKPTLTKSSSVGKARRASIVANKADAEKKVGRRKGPLRPDQRKQASEIRKLGACIRCRFLKKVVRRPILLPPHKYLPPPS